LQLTSAVVRNRGKAHSACTRRELSASDPKLIATGSVTAKIPLKIAGISADPPL